RAGGAFRPHPRPSVRRRVSSRLGCAPRPRASARPAAPPAGAPGRVPHLYAVAVPLGPPLPLHALRWVADQAPERAGQPAVLRGSGGRIVRGGVSRVASPVVGSKEEPWRNASGSRAWPRYRRERAGRYSWGVGP